MCARRRGGCCATSPETASSPTSPPFTGSSVMDLVATMLRTAADEEGHHGPPAPPSGRPHPERPAPSRRRRRVRAAFAGMSIALNHVTIDCADPYELASFGAVALLPMACGGSDGRRVAAVVRGIEPLPRTRHGPDH